MRNRILRKMSSVEHSWQRLDKGRVMMYKEPLTDRHFIRAKRQTGELFSEAKRLMPTYLNCNGKRVESDIVKNAGGVIEINKRANTVMRMVDDARFAIENDYHLIKFDEVDVKPERDKHQENRLTAIKYASIGLIIIGTLAAGMANKVSSQIAQDMLYGAGLGMSLFCTTVLVLASEAYNKITNTTGPVRRTVDEGVNDMREGIYQLKISLDDLIKTTTPGSR